MLGWPKLVSWHLVVHVHGESLDVRSSARDCGSRGDTLLFSEVVLCAPEYIANKLGRFMVGYLFFCSVSASGL